ncbi:MAG: AAA family ATPase [Pseudolysinimonas sp.]|uniref:AAA family ATPase n=1 Tax=Pseudolysinimonas sp. TaxID=2680009 RepID=UPI003C787B9A
MTSSNRGLPVTRIRAENFRSFRDVDVELRPLTVLVGPNGSGKSNLLKVLQFLSAATRFDIGVALDQWGGFERVQRQSPKTGQVALAIEGSVTQHSSAGAPDSYQLKFNRAASGITRREIFEFKRVPGKGRRIQVTGSQVTIQGDGDDSRRQLASGQTSGLGTLARLSDTDVGPGPASYAEFLSSIRVLEPNVEEARRPSRVVAGPLADDAHNLSAALMNLRQSSPDAFSSLVFDLRRCLPGLENLQLMPVGGTTSSVVVQLVERGVTRPIDLADASFGTVRLLALLVALHEPKPPKFTAIEEVDHGLHPYALEVLIERMRDATTRTQILAATHSPTLVNRLEPTEILVCDRDPVTGESLMPARSAEEIQRAVDASDFGPGELWFAGAIGGVPA